MPSPLVKTYDPKLVVATFGAIIITGYASGTFITITRNGDAFEKDKGADGEVDRINKNALDFSVEVTLKQTSPVNALLSTVFVADLVTSSGIYPLAIKELNGITTFFAPAAWIAKDPDDEYSDALSTRPWRFDTGPAVKFTGGNIL